MDTAFLPQVSNLGPGCLSLYLDADAQISGIARLEPTVSLEQLEGYSLYAHRVRSLPPLKALMRFGSDRVEKWLESLEYSRDDSDPPNTPEAREYVRRWVAEYPLYQKDIYAVIGGWHLPWPDGDWDELLEHELMFWTLEEAEPWFEVWYTQQGEFQVLPRVT